MFYVIGDSHVRSFAGSNWFIPFFLGPGKKNCFVSDKNLIHVKKNAVQVLSNIPRKSRVLCVFGEPDARFYLGKGWYPWDEDGKDDMSAITEKIASSAYRYASFLSYVCDKYDHDFFVLPVTPSGRVNQNRYVRAFNGKLRELCEVRGAFFVDIESDFFDTEFQIKEGYMADPVHLNRKVQALVMDLLSKVVPIESRGGTSARKVAEGRIGKYFSYNEAFDCLVRDGVGESEYFTLRLIGYIYNWISQKK